MTSPSRNVTHTRPAEAVTAAKAFVKRQLEELPRDGSHDWWHIERVWRMAKVLAKEEGIQGQAFVAVELAALLHDVQDWKYAGKDQESFKVQDFLDQQQLDVSLKELVLRIIAGIGFQDEISGKQHASFPELAVVQDADRLDAIGAIGIARTFTYGGRFSRVLHDPEISARSNLTPESYKDGKQTTLNHFYEKLLKLKGMMKTEAGRRRAEGRHRYLEEFLSQFHREWVAEA